MKQRSNTYRAFRIAFVLLAGAALLRVAWPPPAPAKP